MPSKPGAYLNWVPGGSSSYMVQPPSGQSNTGWVNEQKAPFRFWNYLLNLIDSWIQYWDTSGIAGQQTVSGNTTADGATRTYLCTTSGGGFTFTLPLAASYGAYRVTIKNNSLSSGNNVTLARTSSDTIEGGTSGSLTNGDVITLESDGVSNWVQVST